MYFCIDFTKDHRVEESQRISKDEKGGRGGQQSFGDLNGGGRVFVVANVPHPGTWREYRKRFKTIISLHIMAKE